MEWHFVCRIASFPLPSCKHTFLPFQLHYTAFYASSQVSIFTWTFLPLFPIPFSSLFNFFSTSLLVCERDFISTFLSLFLPLLVGEKAISRQKNYHSLSRTSFSSHLDFYFLLASVFQIHNFSLFPSLIPHSFLLPEVFHFKLRFWRSSPDRHLTVVITTITCKSTATASDTSCSSSGRWNLLMLESDLGNGEELGERVREMVGDRDRENGRGRDVEGTSQVNRPFAWQVNWRRDRIELKGQEKKCWNIRSSELLFLSNLIAFFIFNYSCFALMNGWDTVIMFQHPTLLALPLSFLSLSLYLHHSQPTITCCYVSSWL